MLCMLNEKCVCEMLLISTTNVDRRKTITIRYNVLASTIPQQDDLINSGDLEMIIINPLLHRLFLDHDIIFYF